jgi:hypothetical protein
VSATDNDRNAGSAKDFVGKVEGAVGSMAGTQAAGVALAETLRDGSQAVAKKIENYSLGALLVAVGVGFALGILIERPPNRRVAGAIITNDSLLRLRPAWTPPKFGGQAARFWTWRSAGQV